MSENCYIEPVAKIATNEELQNAEIAIFSVSGMGCPNCARRVSNGLLSLYGVVTANVDHTIGLAKVAFNPGLTTVEMLIGAVAHAGNDGRHNYSAQLLSREISS